MLEIFAENTMFQQGKEHAMRAPESVMTLQVIAFNDGDVSLAIAGGEELYLSSVQVEGAIGVVRLLQNIFNPKTVDVPAEVTLSLEAELDSIPDADLFSER